MLTSLRHFQRSFNKRSFGGPACRQAGFTLIEMLMVVAIICIVTLVVLFRQSSFDSSTLLRSLAYSVALSLEQAQTYDVAVRGFTPSGSSVAQFAPGYGVYFQASSLGSFNIFADLDGACSADTKGGSGACPSSNFSTEAFPAYVMNSTYKIKDVCGIWASNSTIRSCLVSPVGGGSKLSSLTVYFRRPDPDAYFFSATSGGKTSEVYSAVYVQLWAGGDATNIRTVKVTPTGQITVCTLNVADANTC